LGLTSQPLVPAVDWRRNLWILAFAQFTAIFGFSFCFPFIAIYLQHDLGVHDSHALALWTGAAASASGLTMAVVSPLWGVLADRYGRKSMLLRAMIGGGITVALLAAARSPFDLLIFRILQGGASGTVAATTTLVATGTPRESVGRAMGVISSAVALGSAVGPLAGGVAANYVPLRWVFLGGGVLLLIAVIPVMLGVREAPFERRPSGPSGSAVAILRGAGPGVLAAVIVLLASQTLIQVAWSGGQPLVSLRMLEVAGNFAAAGTGFAFAGSGVASAIAGISYSRLAARWGYGPLVATSAVLTAFALAGMGVSPNATLVIVATFAGGFGVGAALPAVTAMLGLETPAEVQGTVFGFSASANALGFGLGPLLAGTIAGVLSIPAGLFAMAAISLCLMVLILVAGREPTR
jgi:MFS family permease